MLSFRITDRLPYNLNGCLILTISLWTTSQAILLESEKVKTGKDYCTKKCIWLFLFKRKAFSIKIKLNNTSMQGLKTNGLLFFFSISADIINHLPLPVSCYLISRNWNRIRFLSWLWNRISVPVLLREMYFLNAGTMMRKRRSGTWWLPCCSFQILLGSV